MTLPRRGPAAWRRFVRHLAFIPIVVVVIIALQAKRRLGARTRGKTPGLAQPAFLEHYLRLMFAILGLVLAAQLGAVEVDVRLQAESATIRVSYRLGDRGAPAAFTMIRLPDQLVWFAEDLALELEEREGLTRIVVESAGEVTLEYLVQGRLDRIPVPVPEGALQPGSGGVTITVSGLDRNARMTGGFPRLTRVSDGAAQATLANVPSLIRMPPTGSHWTVATIAQGGMVLLLAAAGIFWLVRARGRST